MKPKELYLQDFDIPSTKDVETLLLAGMINYPDIILEVRKVVTDGMFEDVKAKNIWKAILKKFDDHEPIDLTTIWAVSDKEYFREYLIPASTRGDSRMAVISYASVLKDTFIKRQIYFSSVNNLKMIQEGVPANDVLGRMHSFQDDVSKEITEDTTENINDILNSIAEDLQGGKVEKITTGIKTLDYYTYGGFEAGNLIILAARPSVGKTTIALQMGMSASSTGKKVVIFSLELTKKELGKKILLTTGRLQPVQFYTRNFQWSEMENAIAQTANGNILINDTTYTIDEIISKIALLKQEGNCDEVIIDYLGLISLQGGNVSMNQQISDITRRLKRAAKDFRIPIVLLSQLSRASASEGRSPQLYDLRDSGSIEQDADAVLMMERPRNAEEGENLIDMWVRKNRGGKAGEECIHLKGDDHYANFIEYD